MLTYKDYTDTNDPPDVFNKITIIVVIYLHSRYTVINYIVNDFSFKYNSIGSSKRKALKLDFLWFKLDFLWFKLDF